MTGRPAPQDFPRPPRPPRLVAWETTRACNLACRHCRAEAVPDAAPGQLDAAESSGLLKGLARFNPKPMVILSGGEPLMRPDIMELARFGTSLGLRMLLSTNGTLLTPKLAREIKEAGVARLSLSIDAPEAGRHDEFRGLPGSFEATKAAAAMLLEAGLPFQINSTITTDNIKETEAISKLALDMGAAAHHVFLLVPVGRAKDMGPDLLPAASYEEALVGLRLREDSLGLEFKATCAPQYNRISRSLGLPDPPRSVRGCLGGQGFMFVSHDGFVWPCGYLPLSAGSTRVEDPVSIYENSKLFLDLRDKTKYRGSCGDCEYWAVCGGCRARAHAAGDHLGPEPLCPHLPRAKSPRQEARDSQAGAAR